MSLITKAAEEEALLQFPGFSHDHAFNIGLRIRDLFLVLQDSNGGFQYPYADPDNPNSFNWSEKGIVIHISTFTDHTLFSCCVGNPLGIGPDNWAWVEGKKNTVKRFHKSTMAMSFRPQSEWDQVCRLFICDRNFFDIRGM